MELNFTEISDAVYNNETEPQKYWEKQKIRKLQVKI